MWKTFLHVFQIYVPRLIDEVRNTRVINSAVYLREIFRQRFRNRQRFIRRRSTCTVSRPIAKSLQQVRNNVTSAMLRKCKLEGNFRERKFRR